MKKEIIKSLFLWLFAETVLFGIFVLQDSKAAFFCLLFLIFLAAATFGTAFLVRNKISAKAILPPTAEKGKTVKCRVILENKSAFPVFGALCEVLVKNNLTGEENRICPDFFVLPKSKTEKEFEISSNFCGYITAKTEKVYLTDIFGFLLLKVKNFASEKGKMTVLPETFSPVIVFDKVLPVPEESESYSPDKKGNDYSETFQIREYSPGDSIKQIHWKLSEKLDKTIVRDPSLPVAKNIMLFWDKTGDITPKETDSMAEVSCSVAQSLLRSGYEFALGWNSGNRIGIAQIRTEEELLEAIPGMIKFGGEKAEEDFDNPFEHFGKTIIVAKEPPENLFEKEGTSLLICDKSAAGANVIAFGEETFVKDLEFLEL